MTLLSLVFVLLNSGMSPSREGKSIAMTLDVLLLNLGRRASAGSVSGPGNEMRRASPSWEKTERLRRGGGGLCREVEAA